MMLILIGCSFFHRQLFPHGFAVGIFLGANDAFSAPHMRSSNSSFKGEHHEVVCMILSHLLTHLGCVYNRSAKLSQYNNLLLPLRLSSYIRHHRITRAQNIHHNIGVWDPRKET